MALANADDVAVPLGRPIETQAEREQVEWWLEGIERLIVSRLGPVANLDADAVRYVEVEAVIGKARRGGRDESSISVAVDDGTVTRRYENPVAAVDVTKEWWALLTGVQQTGTARIGWLL